MSVPAASLPLLDCPEKVDQKRTPRTIARHCWLIAFRQEKVLRQTVSKVSQELAPKTTVRHASQDVTRGIEEIEHSLKKALTALIVDAKNCESKHCSQQ